VSVPANDYIAHMATEFPAPITSRVDRGVLVITIEGSELQDEKTAQQVQGAMDDALESTGCRWVVLDLQNLRFISSVAFRPLLNLRRALTDKQGGMILCNLSKIVGDVFYTTRMVSLDGSVGAPFRIESDVASAVARLAPSAAAPPSS
jgi:anti-anti-sigma factor